MTINLDFAKGQKTITGVALFLLPLIAKQLGYEITPESITELVSQGTVIFGAVLALYGLIMKFVRLFTESFKK